MRNRFSPKGFTLYKRNIFGAIKKKDDGYTFDSTSEWKRYNRLKFERYHGNITQLEVHPSFDLSLGGQDNCTYSADFAYINAKGVYIVEDVKSPALREDSTLRLKMRMMKAQHNIKVILIHPKNVDMLPPYDIDNDINWIFDEYN